MRSSQLKLLSPSCSKQPAAQHIGHQVFLRQIVDLIDLRQFGLISGRHILIDHTRLNRMQHRVAIARSEPAAQLGGGVNRRPKSLPMLTAALLCAARIVDLAEFDLRSEPDHMAEIDDVSGKTRHHIHAILRKSLFAIEVHRSWRPHPNKTTANRRATDSARCTRLPEDAERYPYRPIVTAADIAQADRRSHKPTVASRADSIHYSAKRAGRLSC